MESIHPFSIVEQRSEMKDFDWQTTNSEWSGGEEEIQLKE